MKVIEIRGKEYVCSKCKDKVNYGSVAGPDQKALTKDGKPYNNKYGLDSNKLSCAVDAGTTTIHGCYANLVQKDYDSIMSETSNGGLDVGLVRTSKTVSTSKTVTPNDFDPNPISTFEIEWNKAYQHLSPLAAKVCEEGATARDKHICLCGMLHDYFSFRQSKGI